MIKNFFTILFSIFLLFSSTSFINATIEDLVNGAKPDRSIPWTLLDEPYIQLNEYHISALNRACGFRAFGYISRNDAIDDMVNALHSIDEQYENRNTKLRTYIENDCGEKAEDYLKSLKKSEYELSYTQNRFENIINDKTFEEFTYTLINAFALLKNVNLCIYEEVVDQNKTISLTHSYALDSSNETLHLLCRGLHYNKLVFVQDENANMHAQVDENNYLNELYLYYAQEEHVKNQQPSHSDSTTINQHDDALSNFDHNISSCIDRIMGAPISKLKTSTFLDVDDFYHCPSNKHEDPINIIEDYADNTSNSTQPIFESNGIEFFDEKKEEKFDFGCTYLLKDTTACLPPLFNHDDRTNSTATQVDVNMYNYIHSEVAPTYSDNLIDITNSNNNFDYINDDNDFYYDPTDFIE